MNRPGPVRRGPVEAGDRSVCPARAGPGCTAGLARPTTCRSSESACPASGVAGTLPHSDASSGRQQTRRGRHPSGGISGESARSPRGDAVGKAARSSPSTTKGNRIAWASSRSATVSVTPLHRSTYRFVSSATLTASVPRPTDPARRVLPPRPCRSSTCRRRHPDSVAVAAHPSPLPPLLARRRRPRSGSCRPRARVCARRRQQPEGFRESCTACIKHRHGMHVRQASSGSSRHTDQRLAERSGVSPPWRSLRPEWNAAGRFCGWHLRTRCHKLLCRNSFKSMS